MRLRISDACSTHRLTGADMNEDKLSRLKVAGADAQKSGERAAGCAALLRDPPVHRRPSSSSCEALDAAAAGRRAMLHDDRRSSSGVTRSRSRVTQSNARERNRNATSRIFRKHFGLKRPAFSALKKSKNECSGSESVCLFLVLRRLDPTSEVLLLVESF